MEINMKFCVIGLGRFGYEVATRLTERGMEVLAIDSNEHIINSIKDKVTQAICINIETEDSLLAIGVEQIDTVIVAMGENFAQSILITALLKKQLHIPTVIARAINTIHSKILKLVGADKVISPEKEVGLRLAETLSMPFSEVAHITEKFAITQLKAPESFIGQTLEELKLRKIHKVSCIGVKKGTEIVLVNLNYVILENDELLFAGENKDLEALAQL